MSHRQGLNLRPPTYQVGALTNCATMRLLHTPHASPLKTGEATRGDYVARAGFEPATFGL